MPYTGPERRDTLRAVDTLTPQDIERIQHMMENFIPINGSQHPEQRLDRIERALADVKEAIHALQMGLSNAQLIQRGVMWVGGIVGTSGISIAMAYIFQGMN